MKKNLTLRILTLTVALLMAVLALASCDAGSSLDSAPNMPPADNSPAGGMEGGNADGTLTGGLNGDYDRKIIRTVTMSCETKAYDDATTVIMAALSAHGGYVEASSSTGTGYEDVKGSERRATYTFRVPAENLDAFLEALRVDEGIRILIEALLLIMPVVIL